MFANPATTWYHSNQYNAQKTCEHCGGVVRHETWCITRDELVRYAYGVVIEPQTMTLTDRLILHALGVSWMQNECEGKCWRDARV